LQVAIIVGYSLWKWVTSTSSCVIWKYILKHVLKGPLSDPSQEWWSQFALLSLVILWFLWWTTELYNGISWPNK
jgi:hypothetical protein